ncbi:MAG TPA: 3-deoxy-7-phosphoheptulonate synthase [Acholeplasmataceae bacterium]|nr:MAG: 3-deoxy-7-phosphoheptulonate synthase [Tenericutes bacterium GWA2_38_26]OHE30559.1 MAG: 3-deoxy-7-phosphoheptulonate synthase [Tenericutes bacterium GWC2_39_45]OHE32148.1 MAG: 3-deoxy-7-phosphoheptulonate synthase [Tenericutes bacterium GWD2_38_27]OHE37508.1 MAG: 3-deoxy-7-phosphoheptulonate synthase [Tenericutes bacterium GWE2_38_8]OHE45642.1 MAG: 3-deoxy-7-phosphoheptulonate synthase [Tenericutes bacterium GWF2_38_8]HBY65580.1 3-deoxy-7-phosphoheptulonate synthase [Acholeplasmataceae
MIIQMKKESTKKQFDKVVEFLKEKHLEIIDASSDEMRVFGVIGDTSSIDPTDLYAFEGVKEVTRVSTPFKKASRSFKKHDTIIKLKNGVEIGGDQFVMMAGPCSIESEEQLRTIAKGVKKAGAQLLRGGAYKPRTSPYAFQGLEVEGLKLLKKIGDEEGLLVVTEIPSADLIPLFEEYVDIIQVGARNMQNFHLLKALGKSNKPILLKRGLSATIEEWLMSAEYIMAGGNDQIILCERGIRTFEKYTRNTLDISAVLAVKELSHLPVIIDPSHAAGRWTMIEKLSLASLAVGAHGLIVEVHQDPEHAMSDGAQSLKIKKFATMMDELEKVAAVLGKTLR